jgi:hypothetical protein
VDLRLRLPSTDRTDNANDPDEADNTNHTLYETVYETIHKPVYQTNISIYTPYNPA